ncbi:MAG: hypothetical protein M3132_04280 [Actinomycetia bacterium]|nr:hypothetical protein [Actinomycetes bacterium]
MSPKVAARQRMEIGLHTIGLAFDRDGISIDAAAEELGVPMELVVESVRPFTDLEYVATSGHLLGDIGHVVTIDGGEICVLQNWVQDLTSLDPGDAALLLAMIETADSIEGLDIGVLRSLRRQLDAIAHISVREPMPPAVVRLVSAKHDSVVVTARYEGSDMRVSPGSMHYEVHDVRWTPHGWRAILMLYGESGARPVDVAAELLHDIHRTDFRFVPRSMAMPEDTEPKKIVEAELEFPLAGKWLLDYYGLEILSQNEGMAIGRIRIATGHAPGRLLLRLGPEARFLSPEWLEDVGQRAATQILDMYLSDK